VVSGESTGVTTTVDIHGYAEEGWGAVADAFRANFERHRELGAACCVYLAGSAVVDLWGGVADRRTGRPWRSDTVVTVFSTTKGATAICAHMLAERGVLDLNAPVAQYWPEFGSAGKSGIRVRWLLSHQAGLPVIDAPLTLEEACAWEPVIRALERQMPLWIPGTQHAYHALTYGFMVGEVVRRVTGKTLGAFFADEVARSLGLDSWIGLPESIEPRVARLEFDPASRDSAAVLDTIVEQLSDAVAIPEGARATLEAIWTDPDSVRVRSGTLGGAFGEVGADDGGRSERIVRAAEFPASNMVSDARSLARMYAATIGEVDGVRLLRPDTVDEMCIVQTSNSTPYGVPPGMEDFVQSVEPPFSLGFIRPYRLMPLLGPRSFGHNGAGGSVAVADPDMAIGLGYVMNFMRSDIRDPRVANLLAAVARCVS
jgi:CubicO group peptidase (beta-lactamase class C family)